MPDYMKLLDELHAPKGPPRNPYSVMERMAAVIMKCRAGQDLYLWAIDSRADLPPELLDSCQKAFGKIDPETP